MIAITFYNFNPVLLEIGPISIRWYGIAYLLGILLGFFLLEKLSNYRKKKFQIICLTKDKIDQLTIYVILGIILGGRLGFVLFYRPNWFIERPLHLLNTLEGGMSFHGGFLGLLIALLIFCKRYKISFFSLSDLICTVAPLGLFFGRLANFINGELYGRITEVPWAIVFPAGGALPRHPSQIYEAMSEGLFLFIIMLYCFFFTKTPKKIGKVTGIFLIGYSIARLIVENYREPDLQGGIFVIFNNEITKGQVLTIPLMLFGLFLIKDNVRNFFYSIARSSR
jgi:phosphatidylglycerol:prolipoprotein diacylglycerol transferase